jgi:hypothetical protein
MVENILLMGAKVTETLISETTISIDVKVDREVFCDKYDLKETDLFASDLRNLFLVVMKNGNLVRSVKIGNLTKAIDLTLD